MCPYVEMLTYAQIYTCRYGHTHTHAGVPFLSFARCHFVPFQGVELLARDGIGLCDNKFARVKYKKSVDEFELIAICKVEFYENSTFLVHISVARNTTSRGPLGKSSAQRIIMRNMNGTIFFIHP